MVFLSEPALQLCEISIGGDVMVSTKDNTMILTAWPTSDKSLTSVALTKTAMELNLRGAVQVKKIMQDNELIAMEMLLRPVGKRCSSDIKADLNILLKNHNERKKFCLGNKICVPYYGRRLIYEIVDCKIQFVDRQGKQNIVNTQNSDKGDTSIANLETSLTKLDLKNSGVTSKTFFRAVYTTKYTILPDVENTTKPEKKHRQRKEYTIQDIAGYDDLMKDIKRVMDIGLNNSGMFVSKGILLYGTTGVGKSLLTKSLISAYDTSDVYLSIVHSFDIYSKSIGESESRLREFFEEAQEKAPSIILLEDVDTLSPKKSTSGGTEHERRIIAALGALLDDLHSGTRNVIVLATTSRIEFVDNSLRRPGRLDVEFEMCVPTPKMRTEILKRLLSQIPTKLTEADIVKISAVTHGFVGADLHGLCSQAKLNSVKRLEKEGQDFREILEAEVTLDDFNSALTVVKPSAMKEVLVEVPSVKWSDIGGQRELKLKLKQAVEWPLKYPEAFERMGITAPKGVLMFGPPGCSKTMIAKALATESKLNFLNIKGPELFSKWVGESEKAVREVFRKARQVAPSIIFIDEIDALGGERSSTAGGTGSNVQERVLAQLLTELDGVTTLGNVTLVAATNRPDKIDKALLRPGRLDRILYVPLPDYETRQEIFNIKMKNMPVAKDVNVNDLVELTEGYSGAEIQAICHEAAMKALEEDIEAITVTKEHFKASLAIVTPRTPASLVKLYEDYKNNIH